MRLHATGGYCTPRHALVLSLPLILAAAAGLDWLLRSVTIPGRWIGEEGSLRPGPAIWALALIGFAAYSAPKLSEPLNAPYRGYRLAAEWLTKNVHAGIPIVDVSGWSIYYSWKQGYTFANLPHAVNDPSARYVVVRENHLHGPWTYCKILQSMVTDLDPIQTFPAPNDPASQGAAKVFIFDRQAPRHVARNEDTRRAVRADARALPLPGRNDTVTTPRRDGPSVTRRVDRTSAGRFGEGTQG